MPVKTLDPFECEVSLDASADAPMYSAAGNGRDYIVTGQRIPRVTWYLGHAPGDFLLGYAAKTAALSAARPLIDAGLFTPKAIPGGRTLEYDPMDEWDDDGAPNMDHESDAQMMADLEKYVDSFAIRPLDAEDAIRMACDYRDHMRAQYRYRDHKARIGSVAHYFKHDYAMGVCGHPTIEHLAGIASSKIVWDDETLGRFERLGKSKDDLILDLAHHALPHASNVVEFIEAYRPEYEFIGLEAMVVNRSVGYAGSLDDLARYRKSIWQDQNDGKWPFEPSLKTALIGGDLKTSNYLAKSTKFQLAAYRGSETICVVSDQSEHSMPDWDGAVALHSKPEEGMVVTPYHLGILDRAFEGFCDLVGFVRSTHNLPRVSKGRKDKPAPKGQRECPISVGVA